MLIGLGLYSQSYFSKSFNFSNYSDQGWHLIEQDKDFVFSFFTGLFDNSSPFVGVAKLTSSGALLDSVIFDDEFISSKNTAFKNDTTYSLVTHLRTFGIPEIKIRTFDFDLNLIDEIKINPTREQRIKSIILDNETTYLLATQSKTNGYFENYLYIIKNDSIIFEKALTPESLSENAIEIKLFQDGILVLSDIQESNGTHKPNLIYLKNDGEIEWIKKYEQIAIQSPNSRIEVNDRNIYLSQHPVQDTNIFYNSTPSILIKLDSMGNRIWTQSFAQRFHKNIDALVLAKNGDILGVGTKASEDPDNWSGSKGWIFRISSSGALKWDRSIVDNRYNFYQNCSLLEVIELESEDILMSGWIMDTSSNVINLKTSTWVVKLNKQGCFNENCDSSLIITSTISIENETSFKIYPNPFNNSFKIHSNSFPAKIKIYTIQGELIQQFSLFGQEKEIDTTLLPSGVYIVQLNKDSGIQVLKAVKR